MAAAVRQTKGITTFTGVLGGDVAFDSNVLAGSAVVAFAHLTNTARTATCTDNNSNSYSVVHDAVTSSAVSAREYAWVDLSVNSGATTVTVTQNTGTATFEVGIAEVTGHDTAAVHDENSTDKTTSDTTQTGAALTPTSNGVMLAWWGNGGTYGWSANDAGWAEWTTRTTGAWAGYPSTSGVVTASTTYTPSFTTTANERGVMLSLILADAAVAGGHPLPQRVLVGPTVGPFRGPF